MNGHASGQTSLGQIYVQMLKEETGFLPVLHTPVHFLVMKPVFVVTPAGGKGKE